MRDGRQDAGDWSWLAQPLTVIIFRCLPAAFLVTFVAKEFDGVGRALLIGVVVLASTGLVWRDIKRGSLGSGDT